MTAAVREAACMLLLSQQPKTAAIRVLMVKRYSKARFMSNLYVFPGGCRDAADGAESNLLTFTRTALRELQEETGLALTPQSAVRSAAAKDAPLLLSPEDMSNSDVIVPFARWRTPKQEKYRYDTWFFAAEAKTQEGVPEGAKDLPFALDAAEIVDAQWVRPETALRWHVDANHNPAFRVPPPTHLLLQELCLHDTPADFLNFYRKKNFIADPSKVPLNEPTLVLNEDSSLVKMYMSKGMVPEELTPQNRTSYPQWSSKKVEGKEEGAVTWELKDIPVVIGQTPPE